MEFVFHREHIIVKTGRKVYSIKTSLGKKNSAFGERLNTFFKTFIVKVLID